MQVGTVKSILNGIAIGKLKIYKKKDAVISAAEVADTAAEEARFEDARAKAIDQQTALYEKALAEAGEDIAEVFNIHAMMLDDDDFVDAIKEIINGQHKCAEYAVKTAGDNHPGGQLQQPHRHPRPQHEHPRPHPVQGHPGRLGRQDGGRGRLQRLCLR